MLEEATYTEMMRCKCVTVQNPLTQGDVREWIELAVILQTDVQLNYMFFFSLYWVIYSNLMSSVHCSWRNLEYKSKNIFNILTTHV